MEEKQVITSSYGKNDARECWFCLHTLTPDYKDAEVLRGFLSPRGKILSKRITGLCAKHQRGVSTAIKRARQVALLR